MFLIEKLLRFEKNIWHTSIFRLGYYDTTVAPGCCATLTHQPTILKPQPPSLILLKSKIPLGF